MTASKSTFKRMICVLLTVLFTLALAGFPAKVSALGLNATSITVTKGYASTLKVTGSSSTVKWSSSDPSVASVSSSGQVIGRSVGKAVITADVGGTKLTCDVKVVGGKLLLSSNEFTLNEGESKYVTVRAKGSHGLKSASGDKSVISTAWVKPWKDDDIRLKVTAVGAGTSTIKLSMTKYPDVTATIKVTVKSKNKPVLLTSQSSVAAKVDVLSSVVIYSDKDDSVNYSFSDDKIAKLNVGTWSKGYCTLGLTGLKEGKTTLTITRKDDSTVKKTIDITVSGSGTGYYAVSATVPNKIAANDKVYSWADKKTGTYKYMLLPANYDAAKMNSAISADSGVYEYYTVYESSPKKKVSGDTIKEFSATIDKKAAKRYVLMPQNGDTPSYNTAVADYTGTYEYWTVYNKSPESHKFLYTDVVKSWNTTVNYSAVTRYILLPWGYDQNRLDKIIADDSGTSAGGYYAVSLTSPTFKTATDSVVTFTAEIDGVSRMLYILVPKNYDDAKVNDAIAAYKGVYEYWTVYTTLPKKQLSYDEIESWTKNVDGKPSTRYMLLPTGYSIETFAEYKNRDLATSNSAYYTVSTTYPTALSTTDTVWMWYNARENVTKYMLLPEKYDVLKRNDTVLKDTGVYEYYTIYSTYPTVNNSTDVVLTPQYNGGRVYMLVPQNWDQEKVNKGLEGVMSGIIG